MNERGVLPLPAPAKTSVGSGWGCHHGELLWIELRILNEGEIVARSSETVIVALG